MKVFFNNNPEWVVSSVVTPIIFLYIQLWIKTKELSIKVLKEMKYLA